MSKHRDARAVVAALEDLAPAGYAPARDSARPSKNVDKGHHLARIIAMLSDHDVKDRQRMRSPIMAFVGPNGGGKTLCAVKTALPMLKAGRKVVSNLPLTAGLGELFPSFELLEDYEQLANIHDCHVLLDEIVSTSSSRASSSLPYQVEFLLQTMRHSNVTFHYTAPSFQRADVILREVTQTITECRGYISDYRALRADTGTLDAVPLWAPKRLFRFRTYDAFEFTQWTATKRDKIRAEAREWFWGPGSEAFDSYDTLASVVRVAESNETGRCLRCGGTRRAKACSCPPVDPRRAVHSHDVVFDNV